MSELKPAQRFNATTSSKNTADDVKLQQRRQFANEDFALADESIDQALALKPAALWPLWLLALLLIVLLAAWQWGLWLQQSWQHGVVAGVQTSSFSMVVLSIIIMLCWREWHLWRRLKLNQQWQQQAGRIAQSMQFGEAEPLCQSILQVMPNTQDLQSAAATWHKAITPQHSDQEQLQLFDTLVLSAADKQARQIIWRASTDTSLAVAISPFAFADMLLVIWRSSRMLRELAALYGAPVGQLRSLAMLKRALAALLWAGSSELALDMAGDLLSSELTAKLSARAGQGIVAGLLVARLGNLAQQQLRPLPLSNTQKLNVSDLSKALFGRFSSLTTPDNKS